MFFFELSETVRNQMLAELNFDIERGLETPSKRLTSKGREEFYSIVREAFVNGDCESLTLKLNEPGYLLEFETRDTKKGLSQVRVPNNAANIIAEDTFNRYYCRAICELAIATNDSAEVQVIRAKKVVNPRPESENKIGTLISATQLLKDLRSSMGVDTALGIPAGPNSGISIKFVPKEYVPTSDEAHVQSPQA